MARKARTEREPLLLREEEPLFLKEEPSFPEEDVWEDIGSGGLVRWDVPKVITGIYQGAVETPGYGGGPSRNRHTMLTDDGPVSFYAPAMLERQLSDPRVQVGRRIQVEFTGQHVKTKGGRLVKEFIVRVARRP